MIRHQNPLLVLAGLSFLIGAALHADTEPRILYRVDGTGDDSFGFKVASLGDVDGDGLGDILASSRNRRGGLSDVHVLSGKTGTRLYTIGEAAPSWFDDRFNEPLSGIGDIDGDGRGDFLIAHSRYQSEGDGVHIATVYSGVDGNIIRQHESEKAESIAVSAMTNVGDIDRDGVPDYGISETTDSGYFPYHSLFSGRDGRLLTRVNCENRPFHYRWRYGSGTGLGDHDKDGVPDLALLIGGVTLVSGAMQGDKRCDIPLAPMDHWSDSGKPTWRGLLAVGDLTKDGIPDLLVSRRDVDTDSRGIGSVALLSGADGSIVGYDLRLMSVPTPDDLSGKGKSLIIVALVGDGLHIRIFNALGQRVIDKTEAELVSGPDLTDLKNVMNLNRAVFPKASLLGHQTTQEIVTKATSIAGHTRLAWTWEARVGYLVHDRATAVVRDVNKDGWDDIAVGAHTIEQSERGYLQLLSGRDGSPMTRVEVTTINDRFGASVAAIGDLDGDGLSEIAVGATSPTAHRHPGYVYVISFGPGIPKEQVELNVVPDSDGTVRLSWPTAVEGAFLEQSLDLNDWEPVALEVTDHEYVVPKETRKMAQYFRLRSP